VGDQRNAGQARGGFHYFARSFSVQSCAASLTLRPKDREGSEQFDGCRFLGRMVHENSTYDIPLRTLCSKDTPNLFVGGRLTDGDSYAGGSLRVMGTSFGTGHAAGVAAAVYAQSQGSEYIYVQKELVRQNAHIKLDQ